MNNVIELRDITVEFDGERVLDRLNLSIGDGEFVTLLGSSGCGKTTTLRVIAGFIQPQSGEVFFDGKSVAGLPPYKRPVNTIFQRYALFPNYNVYENIAFGLKLKKVPKDEIKERVTEMLRLVNLSGFENRSAALDLKLRKDMQNELKNMQKKLGITFIYVTHDQEEALSMSDTVVVMNEGTVQQIGKPTDIYNEPQNAFVADFIGESNIIDGRMLRDYRVRFAGREFECLDSGFAQGEAVDVVIRPEDVDIVPGDAGQLTGTITSVTFRGVHFEIIVDVQGFKWMIQTTDEHKEGENVRLFVEPDAIHIMKKSKYSGMFGDYSSYSDEIEHLSDLEEEPEDDEDPDGENPEAQD